MPNSNDENVDSTSNENNANSTSDVVINLDACEKYGISLSEPPVEPVEPYSRYLSDDTVYGFVTEVTHDTDGTEVEIKDWGYCLEENRIELGFENMKRSQVMEEVIKTYGLVPRVDLSGLAVDVISWDNSTSKSSESNTGGGGNLDQSSAGMSSKFSDCSTTLDLCGGVAVNSSNAEYKRGEVPQNPGGEGESEWRGQKIFKLNESKIGREDTDYGKFAIKYRGKKAEDLYRGIKDLGWKYSLYGDNQDKCANDSFNRISALNCGDSARLFKCCCDVANIPCIVVHCDGHYFNGTPKNGTWMCIDLCNSTYKGNCNDYMGNKPY